MIGRLHGQVIEKAPPYLVLDVQGVGYELQASMNTFYHLPSGSEPVTLFTLLKVREDAHNLYGFLTKAERALFQDFIKINGIGAKAALALLSGMSVDDLKTVISTESARTLTKIPGIGPKTAQRIIMELQDKKKKWHSHSPLLHADQTEAESGLNTQAQQAIQALVTLGYKSKEAEQAIERIESSELACEEMIKIALQGLAHV